MELISTNMFLKDVPGPWLIVLWKDTAFWSTVKNLDIWKFITWNFLDVIYLNQVSWICTANTLFYVANTKGFYMKTLFAFIVFLFSHLSFGAQGPCEKQAVALAEFAERIGNPLLKKGERLSFSSRTTFSTTHLSTVAVQVRFTDQSTAIYEMVFNEFNGHCSGVNTIRRRDGR